MIKKYTSIAFILLANIIFIAHDVFFHYHPDGQVCYEHITYNNINDSKKQNIPGETSDERCLLADIKFITTGNKKSQIVCGCCFNDGKSDQNISVHFILFKAEKLITLLSSPFRQNPYNDYCISSVVKHSFGLRAPPVIT